MAGTRKRRPRQEGPENDSYLHRSNSAIQNDQEGKPTSSILADVYSDRAKMDAYRQKLWEKQ